MATEFRLLGDIQAVCDGRLIDLGHARQRCVLAALLVEPNRAVTVDQLLERAWAHHLPQRARATLSGYISRLRHILGGATDVGLVRQPGGYVLTVDPMAVDLHRFRRLVSEANAASSDDGAARLLGEALELWQGEAFASLDTPWLNSVREALTAERLAAELDRNDLALARGAHAGLLGELATRAAAHPLDERLAGQLILALYRSGRQAAALARYEGLRLQLAEELGADPSPALQRLHGQILTADPALLPDSTISAAPAPPTTPALVPRQLPAPPRIFTGRAPEIAALDTVLKAEMTTAVVISAVSGTAGVGKTALAVHWAHRVADSFSDGQLYVNLRGFDPSGLAMSPAEAVRGFLDAFEVPPQRIPASLQAQTNLYRSLLAGKRVLVVLDNARDIEQVRPLLPGSPGCLVVVTSRNQLTGLVTAEGAHPLALDVLVAAEARDLLVRRLGVGRLSAEPAAVEEIVSRCAGLPLALAVVAARAATHPRLPLALLAKEMREARDGLDAFATEDLSTDLRAVLSWSYHTLNTAAARLFRLLGLHPGPDTAAPAAASLVALPQQQVKPLLADLVRAHLVNEHSPGRYAFHDLLRAYAAELAERHDSDADRHAALHRVLDHYLHTACNADRLISPTRNPIVPAPPQPGAQPHDIADPAEAMAWFTGERRVLLAAIARAASRGFDAHAWHLPWAMITFLERRGRGHDAIVTQHAALDASQRLPDASAQARAHAGLARAYILAQRYDDADIHAQHALRLFGDVEDATGLAHSHQTIAALSGLQGRYDKSLHHGRQAHDLFQAAGSRAGQARALNGIGWDLSLLGDHRQALVYCQQALDLSQELGDRFVEASTLDSLGHAHHHLGHHTEALTCFERAIDIFRDLGDLHREATTLGHAGDTQLAADDPDAARAAWHRAVAILDQLDHPDANQVRAKLRGLNDASANAVLPD